MDGQPLVRLVPPAPKAIVTAPKPTPVAVVKPAVSRHSQAIPEFKFPKGMKLLVPVAVAVLGLVLLGFIVSVPVAPPPHEMTEIMLEEGESRMVSVPFEPTAPPLELKAGKPEVIDHTIFPMKDSEGLLFVLVTGVGSGSTNWSVVMADGRVRTFRTQVVAVQPRTPAADDRALAVKKIEDGDLFLKEAERELGNPYKAVVSYREACEILGASPYGKVDSVFEKAKEKLEEAARIWKELYKRTESDFALARMSGDEVSGRQALANLLTIAPDVRSADYQKNATLLNYTYRGKKAEGEPEGGS